MNIKKGKCGIVVLNYNSHDLTVELANKLCSFSAIDEICVVDNASNDDFSRDFNETKIEYIKNELNLGYNAGNNVGLRYLINEKGCEYVIIANPDVIFENDTVVKIKETFVKDENIALVSTKRYGAENSEIHQYFDFPTVKESLRKCFFLTRFGKEKINNENQNYQIDHAKNGIRYVDAVPGAFFALKSKFLIENNFLYEGIFLYGEELFTGRDAMILGYKAAIINSATYIHNHKRTKLSNGKMFWYDRVSLRKYYKKYKIISPLQLLALDCSIVLGSVEYNVAQKIWKLIKKGGVSDD